MKLKLKLVHNYIHKLHKLNYINYINKFLLNAQATYIRERLNSWKHLANQASFTFYKKLIFKERSPQRLNKIIREKTENPNTNCNNCNNILFHIQLLAQTFTVSHHSLGSMKKKEIGTNQDLLLEISQNLSQNQHLQKRAYNNITTRLLW